MLATSVCPKSFLDRQVTTPFSAALGPTTQNTDIRSSVGPFLRLPDYKIRYPKTVTDALSELYLEYNAAFGALKGANTEWSTDYQYCVEGESVVNYAIQIDMLGLPESFLSAVDGMSTTEVRETMRGSIFEIENSLAMYQFLERIFANGTHASVFQERFRLFLSRLKAKLGMPIALLAVTDQKYQAMRETEFGKNDDALSDAEVLELSGFDRFFSPDQFRQHVSDNHGDCKYLLYVRSSDPVAKLKKPELAVEHPLLGDAEMRRVIKAHALTFNIDAPDMAPARRINDTKEYMPTMGMAFPVSSERDILSLISPEFALHLFVGNKDNEFDGKCRLSDGFSAYLDARGVPTTLVESGKTPLRAKPMKGTYGCYGHIQGFFPEVKFRGALQRGIRRRGGYVVQPEMSTPLITNETDGKSYRFIDRNFFGMVDGTPMFLGGFRSLMPVDSTEAQNGRNHGNESTVWAEIA